MSDTTQVIEPRLGDPELDDGDHERFTHRHLGLDFKLTGVEPARVVRELLA